MKKLAIVSIAFLSLFLLNSITANAVVNGSIYVYAGDNQTLATGATSTTLTGTSTDTGGYITNYIWKQTSGPNTASITSPYAVSTAVDGLISGSYNFTLTVIDNNGKTATDYIVVTANVSSSTGNFKNTPISAQTSTFTASFDAIPSTTVNDSLVGFSYGNAGAVTDLAAIVAFTNIDLIQVRNAGGYKADSTIKYNSGSSYHFRMVVNPASHTYSVYVTPPGGSEIALATNYAFRTEQSATSILNNWSSVSFTGADTVSNFTVNSATLSACTSSSILSITSPANNSTVSGIAPVSISANCSGISKIELYAGSTLVGTTTTAPYTISWNTTTYSNKLYYLTAALYDLSGNITNRVTIAVTTLNGGAIPPPIVSISSPSNGATVTGTVPVTATASSTTSTIAKVEFYTNLSPNTPLVTDTSTPYSATLSAPSLSSGTNTILAKAYDSSGNTSTAVVSVTYTLNDTTPPYILITSPTSGATVSGVVPIIVKAQAAGASISKIEFYTDASPSTPFATTTVAPYSTNLDTTTLSKGTHTILARAYDITGNYSTSTISITVSNVPTNSTVTAGAGSNQTLASGITQATLSGTATTTSGTISSYKWSQNYGPTTATITSPNSSTTTITGLSSGLYNFTFTATDSNGSVGTDTISVTASTTITPPSDIITPTVSISSPTSGSTVSGTIPISANASDNVGVTKVEFYTDVSPNTPIATVTSSPYSTTLNTTTYSNATHTIFAKAYDAAGNTGSAVASTTVANNSSSVSSNAGPDQTIYKTQTSTATLGGSGTGNGALSYHWSEVSTDYMSGATITSPNSPTTTVTGLPLGTFYFKLTVTDSKGSTASDAMMVNVDYTTAPANATLLTQPNWQQMAPNANARDTNYHICYAWQGTKYDTADGYEMEKGGVLGSSIDNMFGKYYSTLNDGYDCVASSANEPYNRSELIPLSHSIDLLTPGTTYVFDWKGYTKEDLSKIANPNQEFAMVWQLHGNDGNSPPLQFNVWHKSSSDSTPYFGVIEGYGNGVNGVGDPIGNTYVGDYWVPLLPVSDFYNHAHSIRITIKEGLQNTGAFWNVQYDGKLVYSRTTGTVGQTLGSDWYKFATMYDWSNSLVNALDPTPNGNSASLVTEKFTQYKL